ncbi:DUF7504 family protein [Halosimplex pelagicum]|uniref:DUF7504 family protein n=1 Tax=Halosimplex pelagicum TaxID=869886 RepID=UPI001C54FA28|nr:hypothetical protein [Halosimplex pelagicum]
MSNWLFPDRDEQAEPAGDAVDPTDPDVDPAEADLDTEATHVDPLRPDAVDPGTSVLVAGPAMTGKRRLLFDLVGGSASKTAAFVTTKKPARKVAAWFAATRPETEEWDLSVVDCTGSAGRERRSRAPGIDDLRVVSSPGDLTGVGIELTGVLREWDHDAATDPRVGLHSLSTLLMYADVKRVYQFLHVVTSRVASVDGVGVYTLDVSAGGTADDVLKQLFDAMVEVRRGDDGSEFRVRGGDFGPRSWTTF